MGDEIEEILFTEISEWSENGESKEITEDAEDDLVDANIESKLCDDMVASGEKLHHRHRRVSLPYVITTGRNCSH